MPSAFVSKLAREGARDPEALAAWIGRRKHGRRAFAQLAKAGKEDAQEQRALMGRVRPGGRLASDLTGFSDDELGRSLGELRPDETARVVSEFDRRDTAARLPGVRADLIGVSDAELGRRLGTADGDESAAIAAEMDRRQMVADVFPDGSLTGDLSRMDESTLGWALSYARPDEAAKIAAEIDSRYPPTPLPPASPARGIAGQIADREEMDRLLGSDPDGWASLAADAPDRFEGMSSTERWLAERDEEAESARGNYSRAQVREMYHEHVMSQLLDAEAATNGFLLSRAARANGVDVMSLFTGPAHIAYARASEDLKRWWQDHPRTTLAEYEEQVNGRRSRAGETARLSRNHQQNRL